MQHKSIGFKSTLLRPLWLLIGCFFCSVFAGETSSIEYLKTPDRVKPLQGILPKKGVLSHPDWGYLKFPDRNLEINHSVDFQNRELVITASFNNTRSKKKVTLWNTYYKELATYTLDMNNLILQKLWLESLIGQENPSAVGQGDTHFELEIPIKMPLWMKNAGIPVPKIDITGDLVVELRGTGRNYSEDDMYNSLWPNFDPKFTPNFSVKGSIGKNLSIQINNKEGFQIADQLKLVYQESEPNEFEDNIIQRIEAGNTSLSLEGTQLTGYSENHQGLFGLKGEFKFGDLYLTAIASQEGGSSHKQTLNSEYTDSEYAIEDKEFVAHKHYFLTPTDRAEYIEKTIHNSPPQPENKLQISVYVSVPRENDKDKKHNYYKDLTGFYAHDSTLVPNLLMKELTTEEFSYDKNTGILSLKRSYSTQTIGAWWSGIANKSGKRNKPYEGKEDDSNTGIIIFKSSAYVEALEPLMLRNRYAVGYTSENKNDFKIELIKSNTGKNAAQANLADLLHKGLAIKPPKENNTDFKDLTGELILPCQSIPDSNARSEAFYKKACLEPLHHIIEDSAQASVMYEDQVKRLNKFNSFYSFKVHGKRKNTQINLNSGTHSLNSGGCMDIAEGSERLTIKGSGTVLQRGKDYDVLYELGQINLTSDLARDPNNEIEVEYECQPLFEIENKFLMGLRAKYPLEGIGTGSLLGATLLYKGQSLKAKRPQYGQTPYSSFLWGTNLLLKDSSQFMTKAVNFLPFIDSKSPSSWIFEFEIAQSYHNPNTIGDALVEDFEGSARTIPYSMYLSSWHFASPPLSNDPENPLDYRYQSPDFLWHSNIKAKRRDIFSSSKDTYDANNKIPILEMVITPRNREGKNWGAIMKSNSSYASDLSRDFEYIEIVAQGSEGKLLIDIGQISEDLSINGFEPNGKLNTEQTEGNISPDHDDGLDGLSDINEVVKVWNCFSSCENYSLETYDPLSKTDPAQDNWREQEYIENPNRMINGTQGNHGNTVYDTEDINRDGTLQSTNNYVRYEINLEDMAKNEQNGVVVIPQENNWKIYRIYLRKYSEIYPMGSNLNTILQTAYFTRLVLTGSPNHTEVRLAKFNIIGSEWETDFVSETTTAGSFETFQDNFSKNGQSQTSFIDEEVDESVGAISVDIIDNRDDNLSYFPSNNTILETEDDDTGTKRREQALVINYSKLQPGQEAHITRSFKNENYDLTNYKNLKMEIHHEALQDVFKNGDFTDPGIRFAVRMGSDPNNKESFYEWSFKPIPKDCSAKTPTEKTTCHSDIWDNNAFSLALQEWPNLKNNGDWSPQSDTAIRYIFMDGDYIPADINYKRQLKALHTLMRDSALATERAEMIAIQGNPSISNITWMRFVIEVDDEELSDTPGEVSGNFWLNDMRLDGIKDGWGSSARSRLQLDFGSVVTISTDLKYQNGNFAPLQSNSGSAKKSPAQSASTMSYNSSVHFHLNKFLRDDWKFKIPFMVSSSMLVTRPFTKPNSDVELSNDDIFDLTKDFADHVSGSENIYAEDQKDTNYVGPAYGYEQNLRDSSLSKGFQTVRLQKVLSVSFSKGYVKHKSLPVELLSQVFLERPFLSYKYTESENFSPTSIDTSYTYHTTARYKLGQLKKTKFKPFSFLKKSKSSWLKGFSKTSFSPWPETFDVTVADLTFRKTLDNDRTVDSPDFINQTNEYGLDMSHNVNMKWKIFNFLTAGYKLNISRDFNDFYTDFSKEELFDSESGGGIFAAGRVFDLDTNDHTRRYFKHDSTNTPRDITYENRDIDYFITHDSVAIDPGEVDGNDYLILLNEFKRTQNLNLSYKPSFVNFITTRFLFNSDFSNSRNNTNFSDDTTNTYWTLDQKNSFTFNSSLLLQKVFDFSKTKKVKSFLKKMKWNKIGATWKVNLNTTGEHYTFADLKRQGVSPGDYYLYSLGLGEGSGWRHPGNIFSGTMDKHDCEDYAGFAEYCNEGLFYLNNPSTNNGFENYPSNTSMLPTPRVATQQFKQSIDRSLKLSTQLTIPTSIPINIQARTEWKEGLEYNRDNPWEADTITTWPFIYLYGTISNIAPNFKIFKNRFSRVGFASGYKYTKKSEIHAHRQDEDVVSVEHSLAPLLKATFTTKKKTTISNSFALTWSDADSHTKVKAIPNDLSDITVSTFRNERYIPWVQNEKFETTSRAMSNDFNFKYEIPTNKGFHFFKWFFRLKNPVIINGLIKYTWKRDKRITFNNNAYDPQNSSNGTLDSIIVNNLINPSIDHYFLPQYGEQIIDKRVDSWSLRIRPSVSYQFTNTVASLAHIEYGYARIEENSRPTQHNHDLEFLFQITIKFGNK